MFNDKPYQEVNREERFFCFLFGHALLSSANFRMGFLKLIEDKINLNLEHSNFNIFIEAAILRDYWHDLGDPNEYSEQTHAKRLSVLNSVLDMCDYPNSIVQEHEIFWTSKKKLWSPSRWNIHDLRAAGLDKLIAVKWAFNSKPDLIILIDQTLLMIEAKVESPIGRDEEIGYDQLLVQQLVSTLISNLIPLLQGSNIVNILLAVKSPNGLTWEDIVKLANSSDIDQFTKDCLSELLKYY